MTQVVIMGQRGVGKTSLVRRFLFNKFSHAYTETIEDDQRQVIIYNNLTMDVTVLDTSGRLVRGPNRSQGAKQELEG